MRFRIRPAGLAVAVVALLALTASQAAAKSYFAERFDALIKILPGGALEVTETVAFRFENGTFDYVFRELATRRTDGIDVVSASMDGRPFTAGTGVDQFEVTGRSKPRVRWRFAPTSNSTHTFVLTYVARGVVTQAPDADVLAWRALPSEHQYRIDAAAIEFVLPGAARAAGEPAATPAMSSHRVGGKVSVRIEPGPEDVTSPPLHARISADQIRPDGWVESSFRLPRGSVISAPPAWQQSAIDATASAPRWIATAAVLVLAGLVLLFGLRQQYDPPPADLSPMGSGGAAPDSLAPGLAGPLLSNGRTTLEHAMGTVFSLAQRGVVAIDEAQGRFGMQDFTITRRPSNGTLAPHEQALLATLFDARHPEQTTLSSARNRVARRLRPFGVAVRQELAEAGVLDADRQQVRNRYVWSGSVLLILAGLAVPLAAFFVNRFAGWPMFLPAGLAIVGIASFIFAGSVTPLSNEGVRRAARWRGFRWYLKEVSRQREQPVVPNLDDLLPFAVAMGLGPYLGPLHQEAPGQRPRVVPCTLGRVAGSRLHGVRHIVWFARRRRRGGRRRGRAAAERRGRGEGVEPDRFRVQGSWVQGWFKGFRVLRYGSGFKVQDRVQGSGVQGSQIDAQGGQSSEMTRDDGSRHCWADQGLSGCELSSSALSALRLDHPAAVYARRAAWARWASICWRWAISRTESDGWSGRA